MRLILIKTYFLTCISLVHFAQSGFTQTLIEKGHVEVSLRMIGHQVLLNSGDSVSRVLPIIQENGQYRIQFETDLNLEPELFVSTVDRIVRQTKLASHYVVEVVENGSDNVVYSFEMTDLEQMNLIPCRSRNILKGDYDILLTIDTLEKNSPAVVADTIKETPENESNVIPYLLFVAGSFALILLMAFRKKKKESTVNTDTILLGQYQFDKRRSQLIYDKKTIELTAKESELLHLLYSNMDEAVERDVILNVIWGDEGDYVGRTLDVFISRLRKKLELDPNIQVVNIRGVGYKLVNENS